MKFKGLLSLKGWAIAGFIILWNLGMGIVVYFNDGLGEFSNSSACFAVSILMIAIAILLLLFTLSEKIRDIFISPKRKHLYNELPFQLIGVVCFILSGFSLIYGFVLKFVVNI
jgi:hypothetical protein